MAAFFLGRHGQGRSTASVRPRMGQCRRVTWRGAWQHFRRKEKGWSMNASPGLKATPSGGFEASTCVLAPTLLVVFLVLFFSFGSQEPPARHRRQPAAPRCLASRSARGTQGQRSPRLLPSPGPSASAQPARASTHHWSPRDATSRRKSSTSTRWASSPPPKPSPAPVGVMRVEAKS